MKILIAFTRIVMQHFRGDHLKNQPSEDRNYLGGGGGWIILK
jgi:hypothetical protein